MIASDDGATWESTALLEETGIDLRDPKLSITPDDRLMISAGGSVYRDGELVGRQPRSAFSADGADWTSTQRILSDGNWLWRVTWHDGVGYGVSYGIGESEKDWSVTLYRTTDGLDFEKVVEWDIDGKPNETTVRFLNDGRMMALVRREAQNKHGWVGVSEAPFTDWQWNDMGFQIGGPNFIQLPDGTLWAAGRRYPPVTVLARLSENAYEPVLELPSEGDCSYPGLVWHEGLLWMSYYSSHEDKTSIYLAKIRMPGE